MGNDLKKIQATKSDFPEMIPDITASENWNRGLMDKLQRKGRKPNSNSSFILPALFIAVILVINSIVFWGLNMKDRSETAERQEVLQHVSEELLIPLN